MMVKQAYFGSRRSVLVGIGLTGLLCAWALGLDPRRLFQPESWRLVFDFFLSAFRPAVGYENPVEGAEPFLVVALQALGRTLRFALQAMSIAIPAAAVLTLLATTSWWPEAPSWRPFLRGLYLLSRGVMALARSVHELIWGLLFITAVGLSTEAAILAIAIPFSGILAKVYSEILEEHSRGPQETLEAAGAGSLAAFTVGLLPAAFPDLLSYTFYRLECGVRSAAVLGFVGIETIGQYIKLASDEFHYREVWTYLYLLLFLILIIEWWGASIRKRLRG
ncbi:MAG: ABC transporter permease subunit [Verrucomicrobiota bacterium]